MEVNVPCRSVDRKDGRLGWNIGGYPHLRMESESALQGILCQVILRGTPDYVMACPKPANESKRLKVLWQYEVLDTVPEEMFDELTELAASICEAPIALVSLVDEDRQWFKSAQGIRLRETDRDMSFCAHAICQPGLFIVSDAWRDARFKNSRLVTQAPKIRFYAGSPLITPDGYALGTLCVLDKTPRKLTPVQKHALQLLARVVVTQLELRRQTKVRVNVNKPARRTTPVRRSITRLGRRRETPKASRFKRG